MTLTTLPAANYSMLQNHIRLVHSVTLKNDGAADLENVTLSIATHPEFAVPRTIEIGNIEAGGERTFSDIDLDFSSKYLANIEQPVQAAIVCTASCGGSPLDEASCTVQLLPFDQWTGCSLMPELLASFVTPGLPAIAGITQRASEILGQWSGSPDFDNYQQRDPARVKLMMAALFAAIKELNIEHPGSAADYDFCGIPVRLCDEIIRQHKANSLDMALLYASCLEAIGLHPLVMLSQSHATAGCWLIPDLFPDSVNDDVSLVAKRTAAGINEVLAVVPAMMCAGADADFDQAAEQAAYSLAHDDHFLLFVDIRRARAAGIVPLPVRSASDQGWTIEATATPERHDTPVTLSATDIFAEPESADVGKQTLWERKLLDLSLRNTLLNTRITRGTLQIILSHVDALEDSLSEGEEFAILPRPADAIFPAIDQGIYPAVNPGSRLAGLLDDERKQHKLRAYLNEKELQAALTKLYRNSRLSLEENGANTLYLAIGMLKWFESDASKKPRYAPILLLPVEIIRRSKAVGFVVRRRDEEVVLNITLVEMLRQFFDISISLPDPLPRDERGLDVPLIFNHFRHAIMEKHGWDVEDMAMLGTFSFSKFVMWNDIHSHAADLARNNIVSSLVSGRLSDLLVKADDEEADDSLEERFVQDGIVLPISADSSQMTAISAALKGESFILHGPPGTGKSQTITNIIANALYRGQRVLFVAEKMAALQVVQQRLEAIGLAPFCLELHSNRAKKSAVLEQLQRTTEVMRKHSDEEYGIKVRQLAALRQELSAYEHAIHEIHPSGLSLYDCLSRYSAYGDHVPCFAIPAEVVSGLTPAVRENDALLVKEYQSAASIIQHFVENPLRGIDMADYAPDKQQAAADAIDSLLDTARRLLGQSQLAAGLLGIDFATADLADLVQAKAFVEQLSRCEALSAALLPINSNELLSQIIQALCLGKRINEHKALITKDYNNSILAIDAAPLLTQWRMADSQWLLKRMLTQRAVAKQLQGHSKLGLRPDKRKIGPLLSGLVTLSEWQTQYRQSVGTFPAFVQQWIAQEVHDWDRAIKACDEQTALNQCLLSLFKQIDAAADAKQRLAAQMPEGIGLFQQLHRAELASCAALMAQLVASVRELFNMLGLDNECQAELSDITRLTGALATLRGHLDGLRNWCIYNAAKQKVIGAGYRTLCREVESEHVAISLIDETFHKSLYRACAEQIFSQADRLNLFHAVAFEGKIKQYRDICARLEKLTQEEICAHLSQSLPALQKEAAQTSEVGILQRNIRNGARGTSLRRLFDQISGILPRMCPCMLMSPLSVAQYIDPTKEMFDLVIFDEASQMPTCEAVGAIARGRNLIVVGDPKQMPPTNFFSVSTFDEENADKEDLESILDDCLALSLPSMYLKWHYRSKNESLIAFSNVNYYDNKLMTFPSPDDLESKVTYQYVAGLYERGTTRQNKAEAQAVVAEVRRRLQDSEARRRSIGIVTFNTNQQSVIEDMLTDLLDSDPALERAANEMTEPIFVKNLENVQGDERDVILFSVGFGPDKEGRIALNFGPLNREGGWRRLNVAVSRARYEMKVFSTLRAGDIDLNRTSATGVAGLKAFLDFAEKGREALSYNAAEGSRTSDGIVASVAAALQQRGYEVKTNIGCSGYRIDLGVVDRSDKSRFALGVIFDGYNYNSAKTTRDREIVQPGVLKALGWNTCRVWVVSWWLSPEAVVNELIEKIEAAFDGGGAPAAALPHEEESVEDPAEAVAEAAERKANLVSDNPYVEEYHAAELQPCTFTADELSAGSGLDELCSRLQAVLLQEAPICLSLLFRKVCGSCGIARTTPRLANLMKQQLQLLGIRQTEADGDTFCWRADQDPLLYRHYRPQSQRDALEIPPEEMATAIAHILKEQGALPAEGLLREVAHEFNYTRLGPNVTASILRGIRLAQARQLIADTSKNSNSQSFFVSLQ